MILNKIIIWGFEFHNHTHSYIHNSLYIGFNHMGYKVYWYNGQGKNNYPDRGEPENFENTLYIVVGVESKYVPLNESSYYIWHTYSCPIYKEFTGTEYKIPINSNFKNCNGIPYNNLLKLHTLWKPCENNCCNDKDNGCNSWSRESWSNKNVFLTHYYYYNLDHNIVYMPWATDLLPDQIQKNIDNLKNIKTINISNFIGMRLPHWDNYAHELRKYNIQYNGYGGTFNINSNKNCSIEQNMKLIQESIIAPALQDPHQIKHEYIPCRIFKNISYGKMGITNSPAVNKLFNNKLIYSNNISELVKEGIEFEQRSDKYEKIKELMEEVRDNHTYINRIEFILEFLNKFKNVSVRKINTE